MKRWIAGLVVGPWTLLAATLAGAEGRKPLADLLVEKGVITKDEAASVQGATLSAWLDRIAVGGDIRLRHESFYRNTADDQHRQRFRLRFGADVKIENLTVGIRLASGSGDQGSANQTLDALSSQKPVWIDRAFVRWHGESAKWLTVTGGRMPNPFYTVYSSDLVWDEEFNPEGLAQNVAVKIAEAELFVNLAQIVLDEDSSGSLSTDQWLFGQQIGVQAKPTSTTKAAVAVTYLNAVNTQNGNLGQTVCQDGNSRVDACGTPLGTTGRLVNDYNVFGLTAMASAKVGGLPVAVMADAVKNTADTKSAVGGSDTKDGGYQAGLILGKASDPKTWEAAYFYKKVGADATLADIADSDFGFKGGTNRKGHIVWAAYNPSKAVQLKAKYFISRVEDPALANNGGNNGDVKRLQVEASVKF
ncbi:MAG: putative porin [Nitrospirota bacterium]